MCFYCTYLYHGSPINSLVNHGPLSKPGEVISWENMTVEIISITCLEVGHAILIGELSGKFSLEWYAKTSLTSLVMGRRCSRRNFSNLNIVSVLNIPLAGGEVTRELSTRSHMEPQTSGMDSRIYQTGSCLASNPHATRLEFIMAKHRKKRLKGREV